MFCRILCTHAYRMRYTRPMVLRPHCHTSILYPPPHLIGCSQQCHHWRSVIRAAVALSPPVVEVSLATMWGTGYTETSVGDISSSKYRVLKKLNCVVGKCTAVNMASNFPTPFPPHSLPTLRAAFPEAGSSCDHRRIFCIVKLHQGRSECLDSLLDKIGSVQILVVLFSDVSTVFECQTPC